MHFLSSDSTRIHFFTVNMTRLISFLRIGLLLIFTSQSIMPVATFAAFDLYRNADSGFIEAGQSMRINGSFLVTTNFTLTGGYFDYRPAGIACSAGQILSWSGSVSRWLCGSDQGTVGSGLTSNYLPKWNGSNLVNSLYYDDGTNIGIGTSSP
jgi:hypothetical protein